MQINLIQHHVIISFFLKTYFVMINSFDKMDLRNRVQYIKMSTNKTSQLLSIEELYYPPPLNIRTRRMQNISSIGKQKGLKICL